MQSKVQISKDALTSLIVWSIKNINDYFPCIRNINDYFPCIKNINDYFPCAIAYLIVWGIKNINDYFFIRHVFITILFFQNGWLELVWIWYWRFFGLFSQKRYPFSFISVVFGELDICIVAIFCPHFSHFRHPLFYVWQTNIQNEYKCSPHTNRRLKDTFLHWF